jgi:XTP/dITP diphosphohydrolase
MHRLFLATRNAHKTREFAEMLGGGFVLDDLGAHPKIGEAVEDGATFAENARLKARAVSRRWPGLVLADDSGLVVDSLGGAPGVFSARYSGQDATDAANRRKLLEEMALLAPKAARTARFRCVLALARRGEILATLDGAVEGEILRRERGPNGFGYDSLFLPCGSTKTFAQFSAAEKNTLSHRAVAVAQLRDFLRTARLAD